MNQKSGAETIFWDLTDLYTSVQDPAVKADMDRIRADVAAFSASYRGCVHQLQAPELALALKRLEGISDTLGKIGSFAYLLWSTDTANAAYGKFLQAVTEFSSEIHKELVFFDVEWLALSEEVAVGLISSPETATFRHYLESSRRYKKHILSEKEEQLLNAKSVTGSQAWVRYFDETLGAARFVLNGDKLTEQEVLSKLHDADRKLRKKAAQSLTDGFMEMKRSLTFIFNTLLADKQTNDALRGYESWISSRNLSNQISDQTVQSLISAVKAYYPVVQRYYRLKRRLLGYKELMDYDRYAPIVHNEVRVSWNDARKMVIDAFHKFHPDMGHIADLFFERNWIDASIRPGKRGGAYSASTVPSVHPYVFMNYDGKIRDVQTLAHELGHGVHQYLSREQGPLQCDTPLTTAETASVFGEMLVFQELMQTLTDPEERLALLISKIDDTTATVFRQVAMNQFEEGIHQARRSEGELESARFNELWMQTQTELYGDAVTLSENYHSWWCYIPHFLHTPGYVYAYAFGELLVLALYEQYHQQKNGFSERYLDVLKAGGSDWPERIIGTMGVDINDTDFWKRGLDIYEQMVTEAEQLAEEIKTYYVR